MGSDGRRLELRSGLGDLREDLGLGELREGLGLGGERGERGLCLDLGEGDLRLLGSLGSRLSSLFLLLRSGDWLGVEVLRGSGRGLVMVEDPERCCICTSPIDTWRLICSLKPLCPVLRIRLGRSQLLTTLLFRVTVMGLSGMGLSGFILSFFPFLLLPWSFPLLTIFQSSSLSSSSPSSLSSLSSLSSFSSFAISVSR